MKKLVIVESPAKIKTISKILGKDFKIMSTIGHIIDLPTKQTGVSFDDDGFTLDFTVIDGTARNWFVLSIEEEPTPEPEAVNLPEYGQVRTAIGDPPVYGATILRS